MHNYPEKSNFASHLLKEHHSFNPNYFQIRKIFNENSVIDTWQELEIYKKYHSGYILIIDLLNTLCT